jgi:hypothetical protein
VILKIGKKSETGDGLGKRGSEKSNETEKDTGEKDKRIDG